MKESTVNSYDDLINNIKGASVDRLRKLSRESNIINILNQYKSNHIEYDGYTNYLLLGYLTHLDTNDEAPICPICKKKKCLIDSQFQGWNTKKIKYNSYCIDCRDQWVADKISSIAMNKTDEEKKNIAEKKSTAWNNMDSKTYSKYCQNRKDAFNRRDPEVEKLRIERCTTSYRNRTPEQKAETSLKLHQAAISKNEAERQAIINKILETKNNWTLDNESELLSFVQSIYNGTINKVGSCINLPNKRLAFEYDILHYQSKNYHLSKTLECEKQGIHLIHIFENEWILKRPIVESRIKNLLGLSTNKIFARKCTIREVDSKEYNIFVTNNHLQGYTNASVKLGLYYNDELVSLMSFIKSRFSNTYEWELLRFCNKLDTSVVGGAGKLLSYFERAYKPKSLISYADRRWSNGNLYKHLGFLLDHTSPPDYWYWKDDYSCKLYNRVTFQKHKLKDLLDRFDDSLSEVENMYMNRYYRIFDCGNLVYVKRY